MREKELRLALICYGGISLAVYMHGITREVWHLARASRAHHGGEPEGTGTESVYARLLRNIADSAELNVRVLVDILAGASAGGINAIFLAEAISTGRSLDPLTDLWLDNADVDRLMDPGGNALTRLAKSAAVPLVWALTVWRGKEVDRTVEPAHREEVRTKLAHFVRARWFAPPFGGPRFVNLLLDAFAAMADSRRGAPLLPEYQPLDLFVTVTDFRGYEEKLRLNSPAEISETEHRLILSFHNGGKVRALADPAELAFAARATASFPGAFPPFQVRELDAVLKERGQSWPGRDDFLTTTLPRQAATGTADAAVLIDGSVLANAPFRPAMAALQSRPSRREVDRRFVYIDPTPGPPTMRFTGAAQGEPPGFFATLFGALSDIPREQPIRDNLDAIDTRSTRIRRMRHIIEAMRPEVEAAIERTFGMTLLLSRPRPDRIASWRTRAQNAAAREAGFGYAAYGHLKIAAVVDELAALIFRLGGGGSRDRQDRIRHGVWDFAKTLGLDDPACMTGAGASPAAIDFLRTFDLSYRTRRLRFVARRLAELDEQEGADHAAILDARQIVYELIGGYRYGVEAVDIVVGDGIRAAEQAIAPALSELSELLALKRLDDFADGKLADALVALPKAERRAILLTYLGFPFYDVATLPLLQSEGLDEFEVVKVDRISPDDCGSIRSGGAHATLKGIQFFNFGAFFSRAYRENDYLWGRLHGVERLIDIIVSTPVRSAPPARRQGRRAEARRLPCDHQGGEAPPDLDHQTCFELEQEIG